MRDRKRLIEELASEGLQVTEWHDDPGASYPPHSHPHREVRVVLEGRMTIRTDERTRELGPGDRIDLDPGERHSALVGLEGVRYLAGSDR